MTASGMIVINPPWKLEQQMNNVLPWLHKSWCRPASAMPPSAGSCRSNRSHRWNLLISGIQSRQFTIKDKSYDKHYDYIAIGGGSGGIASINRAAMYGQKCALIEAKELGGTCVNVGCVPKKVMWHAAQIREAIHLYGPDYGFDTTINHFDWDKLVASRSGLYRPYPHLLRQRAGQK
jgi:hypothetical protein